MRARIEALRQSGAPYRAHELALQSPELFQKQDLEKYEGDKTAVRIRWGEDGGPEPLKRYDHTDQAIRDLLRHKKENLSAPEKERAQSDLIQAFHNRLEMKRAIIEFENYKGKGKSINAIPSYVLIAAGEAYLQLREPQKAREILEEVHRKSPLNYKNNVLLYYAHEETEDHDKALAFIRNSILYEPKWILGKTENSSRKELEQTLAASPFYSNLNNEGQKTLEDFNNTAPANLEILRLLSDLYNARGLPRASLEKAELGLALEPQNIELQVAKIKALISLNRIEEARYEKEQLVRLYPEQSNVQDLEKEWKVFDKWEIISDFQNEKSSGTTFGSKSSQLDTKLYSPPIYNHYRVFAHDVIGRALFPEGMERLYRQGAGVEYRGPDWEIEGEVDHNAYPTQRPSFRLSTTWNPQDEWLYSAQGEYFSLDTPMRALKNHIFSNKFKSGVTYQKNEDFSAGIQSYIQNFSDRNLWGGVSGFMKKDILVHPKRKIDLRADVGTDFSRLTNVIYFSPKRTLSYSLTTSAVDQLWRQYENEFHHRVTMSGGFYSQKGFKTEFVGKIGYQHEIKLNKLYELIYGVERGRNVYDGGLEYSNTVFIKLNARF
ncbi:Poly-beta-1,6 N-acetyl-D-glucosamine export porin PgaA [Candidatus Bealeia paramacronuclearis]|uniref:Poly-beta-1,6 N-acetyl-D-glucosamine export porin PgaA n=1 Tax=Candidatus Bealeia paramacronuclearis TaxID=1921001 RepID=A0ABZ2C0J4_9PROT|nr:Poly-beta-1,6 N-acetyl-D-glucosamine export porin PgaA [Candidatus Bealeia paramacronuclearis]